MRYHLKWLFVAVTLLGLGLGGVAWPVHRQRAALRALDERNSVYRLYPMYEVRYESTPWQARAARAWPSWLPHPGRDWFGTVVGLRIASPTMSNTEVDLALRLPVLKTLRLTNENLLYPGDRWDALRCGESRIDDAGVARLTALEHLEQLDLSGSQVTDLGVVRLVECQRLRSLWLSRTRIGDAGCAALAKLPALEELILEDTLVGDVALEDLAECSTLKWVFVTGPRLSDEGNRRLRERRADLHFYPAQQEASWNAARRPAGTILDDPLGPPAP